MDKGAPRTRLASSSCRSPQGAQRHSVEGVGGADDFSRPVHLHARLSAASTAFVPVGPGNCTLWSRLRGCRTTRLNVSRNSRLATVYASSEGDSACNVVGEQGFQYRVVVPVVQGNPTPAKKSRYSCPVWSSTTARSGRSGSRPSPAVAADVEFEFVETEDCRPALTGGPDRRAWSTFQQRLTTRLLWRSRLQVDVWRETTGVGSNRRTAARSDCRRY